MPPGPEAPSPNSKSWMQSDSAIEKLSVPLHPLCANSVLGLFYAVFHARSLATGHRLVYDIFSTHSKEIA